MNDFTKQELYFLSKATRHIRKQWVDLMPEGQEIDEFDLEEKINLMIDNYCEHDPHGHFIQGVDKCRKCGVICEE